jgi:hypothetical protein
MNTKKKLSNTMKWTENIDKLGTIGLFLTAIFSPCCFPLFAFGASALGFGSFELFGGWTMWIFQAMVLISISGLYFSYRKYHGIYPITVGIISGLLVFYGYYFNNSDYWTYFLYSGMFGLFIATIWNYQQNKINGACNTCVTYNGKTIELESTITCPKCGYKKTEIMPTDACQFFYDCENCKTVLKPLQGDCCVYCSYGSVKCPPIQSGENCC